MKIKLPVIKICSTLIVVFSLLTSFYPACAQSPLQNYILTRSPRVPITDVATMKSLSTDQTKVNSTVQYIDGLGRPVQTVIVKGSPNGKDLVQHMEYDAFGREAKKYLPYADQNSADGSYKLGALNKLISFYANPTAKVAPTSFPYAETRFEASPLSRILEQGAPDAAWQLSTSGVAGGGHTVKMEYLSNDAASLTSGSGRWARRYEVTIEASGVRTLVSAGAYGLNQLYVSISKDENWVSGKSGTTEEYKDKEGRVVLKRSFNLKNGATEILSTYYVYDDFGNLCFVLPPGADPDYAALPTATTLNNFCYQYRYDERQRLVEKRLPGRGLESMVYNKRDQMVAHQNADLVNRTCWNYTKYDAPGRVIVTGWWKNGNVQISRLALQARLDTQAVLWERPDSSSLGYNNLAWPQGSIDFYEINFYDNYEVFGLPATYAFQPYLTNAKTNHTQGLMTATMNRSVENSTNRWNVFYYDKEGRVIQTQSNNHVGGKDIINNQYDFTGQLIRTQRNHTGMPTVSLATLNTYTYDHQGRKIDTRQKIGATVDPSDTPAGEIVRINTGGPAVQFGTELWAADQYYTGGSTYSSTAAINNTDNDAVFQSERKGNFSYNIPVPQDGKYTVDLSFAEIYFQTAGSRVFNVDVENGQFSLQNLDLYQAYGYRNPVVIKAENMLVSDGFLTITFTTVINNAKISGITVFSQDSSQAEVLLAHHEYNELGQLVDKKLHSINEGLNYLQSIDYRYNSRGWLTSINNPALSNDGSSNDDLNDQFGMSLNYVASPIPQYNGNIGQMNWKTARLGSPAMAYDFRYDKLNRLTEAVSSTAGNKNGNYSEYLSYTNMGNIDRLGRYAWINGARQQIDSLEYTYEGNRHRRVDDLSTSSNKAVGFDDQGSLVANEITYDPVGKLKADGNKKITSTSYSIIEAIQKVIFATPTASQLDYEYDRTGNKLKKKFTSGTNITTTDYVNGIQYDTEPGGIRTLSFIQTEEGRVKKNGSTYTYEYDLKDHLGNTRVTISPVSTDTSQTTAQIIQESSYYAFGMQMPGPEISLGEQNKYLYNGKELQAESGFNLYDYGARFYDPAIGKWNGMDPLVEDFDDVSPYNYALNSPVRFTDPNGMAASDTIKLSEVVITAPKIKPFTGFLGNMDYYLLGGSQQNGFTYNKDGVAIGVGYNQLTFPDLSKTGFHFKSLLKLLNPKNWGKLESLADLFSKGRVVKASELIEYAEQQGWKMLKSPNGPIKYVDEKNIIRITIKQGSPRAPGSGQPHVSFKNSEGKFIDPKGNLVNRNSVSNHTPINYDLNK